MCEEILQTQLAELGVQGEERSLVIQTILEARQRIKTILAGISKPLPPESWLALDPGAQEIYEALTEHILDRTEIVDPHDHNEVYNKNEEAKCKAMSIVLGVTVQTKRIDQITKQIKKQTRE